MYDATRKPNTNRTQSNNNDDDNEKSAPRINVIHVHVRPIQIYLCTAERSQRRVDAGTVGIDADRRHC